MSKQFKVITIDGGGIKGLYSAKILSLFETELRRLYGDETRIVDYTDMICGTSTGGLIALALASRIPADRICMFYEEEGPRIFRGSQGFGALLRQTLFRGKFSDKALREALNKEFQGRTMGDSDCLLCIPTYDFTHGTYGVFKFDHKEGRLNRHNSLPMLDVAMATSAAPTYFPLAQIAKENDTQYVDGGVWANNPSLVGLAEAIRYFVGPGKEFSHLNILSVASLNFSSGKPPLLRRRRAFWQWGSDLFDLSLNAQSEFADFFLSQLQQLQIVPMTYTRIPSAMISADQIPYIKLDLATPESLALMKQFAMAIYYKYHQDKAVIEFFNKPKTYHINE